MRSRERVDTLGEVFTPRPLALEMLRRVPKDHWSDPSKTFLDPTCGNGAFLSCVVSLRVGQGLSPLQALRTTYGVDIMQDNVDDCRERMLKCAEKASNSSRDIEWVLAVCSNVVCADALKYDFTFPPIIVSFASDHDLAHRYALYLQSKGRSYDSAYLGTRWELGCSRYFGPRFLQDCIVHLERSIAGDEVKGDFEHDIVVNGVKVDFKSSTARRGESNLIITEERLRADVTYVTGEARDDKRGKVDMLFTYRGSSPGDASLFASAARMNMPGKLYALKLEEWSWLAQRLGL
jgi:hypothetical protein